MKKLVLLCAAVAFASSAWAHRHRHSQDTQDQSNTSTDTATSVPDSMAGRLGIGAEIVPGATAAESALSADYWLSDRWSLDAAIGEHSSSVPLGTNQTVNGTSDFILGVGARYDIARPVPALHVQLLGNVNLTDGSSSTSTTVLGNTITNSTNSFGTALFVGAGIEGFIPWWENVSLELNTGMNLQLAGVTGGTQSGFNLAGSSYLPFNFGIHYYFR